MQRAIALPPSLSALGLYNKAEATATHTKNAKQLLNEAKEGSKEEEDVDELYRTFLDLNWQERSEADLRLRELNVLDLPDAERLRLQNELFGILEQHKAAKAAQM